jgi:GST-like protein
LTFQVIYQGVLMSVVAIVAYNRAVTLLGAGAAAAMTTLLPAIVSALAIFVLGEVPSWLEGSAIAFIAAGVILGRAIRALFRRIFRLSSRSKELAMIRFYFHPTPNPAKVALFLEEAAIAYQAIPVDTSKGEQHSPGFRAINPNGKVPAIVDTDGPGGKEARVFDSSAILLYLGDKIGRFVGTPADRPELLSWLFFIATGIGPFSGQAVHFQHAAPEKLAYAVNRYRREVERHYRVLDEHLAGRETIVGSDYTIADMSAWGWLDRASRVLPVEGDTLAEFPNLKRWFQKIDARPAVARARSVGKDHAFKKEMDDETRRALFPSNYPAAAK